MNPPSTVRRAEIAPNFPVFEIDHPAAHARVAQHGAQVLEWTPRGRDPVLYLSPRAVFREGRAIRGGVPVCWPWFGVHETDPSLPACGVLMTPPKRDMVQPKRSV